MKKENIVRCIMQCTPRELQRVIEIINDWEEDFGDEKAGEVKTVQDIIDLLTRPEYIEQAENEGFQTGENYFKVVFGVL